MRAQIAWIFVILGSLIFVSAAPDMAPVENSENLENGEECKTVWYEEENRWVTLCDEDIALIGEYKQEKKEQQTEEVKEAPFLEIKEELVEEVQPIQHDSEDYSNPIFEEVENGFGIVPNEKKIFDKNTKKEVEHPKPILIEKKSKLTFTDLVVGKVSNLFGLFSFRESGKDIQSEEKLIQMENMGDEYYEMNVDTQVILKDIKDIMHGFGTVTHPWIHPKFLESYISEVGIEDATIRLSHKTEDLARGFPPTNVHTKLVNHGAEVMVYIKGVPAEENIAYCSEYSGTDCIAYEPNGPTHNLQGWKNYVKDVVSFYNSLGVKYFIIWNEPNYQVENWKEVCRSPNDCWQPTMEEFIDITITGVEAIYEVDPNNKVGVAATSSFFGKIDWQNGTEAYVSLEIFEALEEKGLSAIHHFHNYNPDPYNFLLGGSEEQALEYWNGMNAYEGANLDEFSDGLENMGAINGDGIHAVSSTMALIGNIVNFDIERMGWFQLHSSTHEPGTIEGRFLGWNENMIDRSGIFKPVFWLSKLLHEAPGTLLLDDDLNEEGTVRAFGVRDYDGNSYCLYSVNFNREGKSATLKIKARDLPTDVKEWTYRTYKIGREDGNPYHDEIEPEIQNILQPIIDNIENTHGSTWNDYIDEAWPTISEINSWESIKPTETEERISGNRAEMNTQITLENEEIRIICIEAIH